VYLGFGSSVDLFQRSVCGSRSACFMWIYSKDVHTDLGCGSSVDLLQRGACGSRPACFMWIYSEEVYVDLS